MPTVRVAAKDDDGGGADEVMMDEVDRKYGPPREFDPKFHGPIHQRGCTDIICLLLFIAFLIGWGVVAVIAFRYGDPSILVHPVDSWGRKCGLDPEVANKSFLYFFDITRCASPKVLINGCPTIQVCVEHCPDYGPWAPAEAMLKRESEDSIKEKMICQPSVDKSQYNVTELLKKNRCAKYILPVKPRNATNVKIWRRNPVKNVKSVLTRRCIPNVLNKEAMKDISKEVKIGDVANGVSKLIELLNAKQYVEYMFEDLRATWHLIVWLLVAGAVASLIWISLMRCFAGIMVWTSLIGMLFVLAFSCYFSIDKYLELRRNEPEEETPEAYMLEDPDAERFITEEEFTNQFDTLLRLKNTWLTFAIVTGIFLAILLIIVIFIRSRLAIAVSLIRQGARAVGDMLFTLLWPLAPWALQVVGIGFFLLVGVFLISSSEEVYRITQNCTCGIGEAASIRVEGSRCILEKFGKTCGEESECFVNNACQFALYGKLSHVGWYHLYNFFGVIWLLCFISDFGDMVLAGAFAGWYWTLDRKTDLPTFPLSTSVWRTLRYHLGTLAFGSLIISIIKFIRFFLEYIDQKLKQYSQDNPIVKGLMCCCKCFFWCLEKFMRFINRQAYIMSAVYGKNFCTSARDAFFLIMRNAVRTFVLNNVADFLLFMGKLVIVGGISIASFYIFAKQHSPFQNELPMLHFYLAPVIVVAIGTYFIATLFFKVYEMGVDTLFLCFLEDCERNDGSSEKPYYMPKELMGILGKKNKIPEVNDRL